MAAVTGCAITSTETTAIRVVIIVGSESSGSMNPPTTLAMPTSARRMSCDVLRRSRSVHGALMYASNSRSPISSSYDANRRVAIHCSPTARTDLRMIRPQTISRIHAYPPGSTVPMTGRLIGWLLTMPVSETASSMSAAMSRMARALESPT